MDKVSILVPIYNVEKYIERCAISLFEQTYNNIEYIFVDDKGADTSIELLKKVIAKYPERAEDVKIIDHIHNRGLAAARNTAIDNATGKYIIHVDSDDFIEKDLVEKCIVCQKSSSADIVLFGFNHLLSDRSYVELQDVTGSKDEYINKLILRETAVCVCGAMYKRSLYLDNGINAIEGLNMGEDYVTKPRLVYFSDKIASLNIPLYNYVHYNESSYTNTCNAKTIENLYRALEILKSFFTERNDNSYSESLLKADTLQTILLIKLWGSTKSHKSDLDLISRHIKQNMHVSKTSILNSLLILLAKYKMVFSLRLIVRAGLKIKHILK